MEKKFDLLVVGELNVDILVNGFQQLPELGKEVIARSYEVSLGSSSAIFASNISVLGTSVAFLGLVGDDDSANLIVRSLKERKVNTDFIESNPQSKTGTSIALNMGEDRYMITYPGAMEQLTESDVRDEQLLCAKHLHVSSPFLQLGLKPGLEKLFMRAKNLGLTTSLDTQWDPEEKWELNFGSMLKNVDVFLPNEKELIALSGEENLEHAIRKVSKWCKVLVVKRGAKGAMMIYQEKTIEKPSFINTSVVDAIGAGDSFNAGYIHSFIKKSPDDRCLELANLTGALNTTGIGGTGAFEHFEDIKKTAFEKFGFELS